MSETVPNSLATLRRRDPTSQPGDEFGFGFRGSGAYRKAVVVAMICASVSAGLIVMDLVRSIIPETREVVTTTAPFSPGLLNGLAVSRVHSTDDLVAQLKADHLWEMPTDHQIPLVIFANYPADFGALAPETKKKAFLHTLLPAALLARDEIARERETLEKILAKFRNPNRMVFDSKETGWQDRISKQEVEFINYLAQKYRSRAASDLLARVDTFPVSLIMAQAALESSWGSSRFAEEGNNIFGLWTWSENGLVPAARDKGKDHKVAVYDTILGSVRAYLLTLNRLPAYRRLRQLRRETRDPLVLAKGLHYYSEKGMDYVAELKQIIRGNQLERYDHYHLAGEPPAVASDEAELSRL